MASTARKKAAARRRRARSRAAGQPMAGAAAGADARAAGAAAPKPADAAAEVGVAMPGSLRLAAGVLLVQALGLALAGLVEMIDAQTGHPSDRATATFLGGLVVFYAVVVALAGRGIARGRTWAGTPAFLVEFFAIVIGIGQLNTLLAVSVVLLVSAVIALAALVHPNSRAVLIRPPRG